MKEVGIVTIQRSSNYGACLQCYALYKYVESFIKTPIEQVPDPSFLLTRNEWMDISIPPKIVNPYILRLRWSSLRAY